MYIDHSGCASGIRYFSPARYISASSLSLRVYLWFKPENMKKKNASSIHQAYSKIKDTQGKRDEMISVLNQHKHRYTKWYITSTNWYIPRVYMRA